VTSFNEWHEGTQIEPARAFTTEARTYLDFDGAYDKTGVAAQTAYLDRTAYWIAKLAGS
jgi:glycoprotein endo-alpha-1,2-mannosidase